MKSIRIIISGDGSHTLRLAEVNESYHSVHGAISESMHVYINSGLMQLAKDGKERINILEVGFGTGLNALLTWQKANQEKLHINYHCLEPFPIRNDIWSKLNYPDIINDPASKKIFYSLHEKPWNTETKIDKFFLLTKYNKSLQQMKLANNFYELVYFDAFAPKIEPGLWNEEVFLKIYVSMSSPSILTTYSAKGSVKRVLQKVGFDIESLEGPEGKREITRALKKK